jgi:acetyl esterase
MSQTAKAGRTTVVPNESFSVSLFGIARSIDLAAAPVPGSKPGPIARACLKMMERMPALEDTTPGEARQDLRLLMAASSMWFPVASVRDVHIPGPSGPIPARVYFPWSAKRTMPLLVWYHGGGFVLGDLETADPTCRALAVRSGAIVASVDYRRAPEHRFSQCVDDAHAAALWAIENAAALGSASNWVALGGDSAGGTLTALVSQRLRAAGGPQPALQVLVYPCTDCSHGHSNRTPGVDRFLTWDSVAHFDRLVFSNGEVKTDPAVSAIYADDLSGLPPAILVTGSCDLLCTDGEAYARKLRKAGVPVETYRYEGQIHGFFMMDLVFPAARRAHRVVARRLRALGAAMFEPAEKAAGRPVEWTRRSLPLSGNILSAAKRWPPLLAIRLMLRAMRSTVGETNSGTHRAERVASSRRGLSPEENSAQPQRQDSQARSEFVRVRHPENCATDQAGTV